MTPWHIDLFLETCRLQQSAMKNYRHGAAQATQNLSAAYYAGMLNVGPRSSAGSAKDRLRQIISRDRLTAPCYGWAMRPSDLQVVENVRATLSGVAPRAVPVDASDIRTKPHWRWTRRA